MSRGLKIFLQEFLYFGQTKKKEAVGGRPVSYTHLIQGKFRHFRQLAPLTVRVIFLWKEDAEEEAKSQKAGK